MLIDVFISSRIIVYIVTSNYFQAAICTAMPCMYSSYTLTCQESPGAGGIRALRCLTQRRTGVNIFIICTAHRFLRKDAWERKSVCTRQCISGSHLIAKFHIFSRYTARLSAVFHISGTDERKSRSLRKPRKSGLMTGRESKPPSSSPRTR